MKSNLHKLLAFSFIIFSALGCSVINQVRKEVDKTQQPQVITGTDGKTQITVPGMWKRETELNDSATLQASHRFNELYIIVIPLDKIDLAEDMTLDKIHNIWREDIIKSLTDVKIGDTVPVIINGYSARQYEVAGTVEGFKVKYIYTTVDAPSRYYQIGAWTLASRYDSNKNQLLEVINSFKENASASGDKSPPPPAPVEPTKPKKK